MGKRASRVARFEWFKGIYGSYKAEYIDMNTAKQNVELAGHVLYKSELDKFTEANPDIDSEDFTNWLTEVGGLKSGGRVVGQGRTTALGSDEKAEQIGVSAENLESYKTLIGVVSDAKKQIHEMISDEFRVSFAITRYKKRTSSDSIDEAPVEQTAESSE